MLSEVYAILMPSKERSTLIYADKFNPCIGNRYPSFRRLYIKANRLRCQMTQEFVAETVGVSRQAVSKWESGASDPSTSNLVALAKLFGISPEELLHDVK